MIYLTEQDALELLTIHDALTAVAQALSSAAKGTAAVAPRSRASLNGLSLADAVVTTSATDPLVHPKHVRQGTPYIFTGSNNPGNTEAAPSVLAVMDLLSPPTSNKPSASRARSCVQQPKVRSAGLMSGRLATRGSALASYGPTSTR